MWRYHAATGGARKMGSVHLFLKWTREIRQDRQKSGDRLNVYQEVSWTGSCERIADGIKLSTFAARVAPLGKGRTRRDVHHQVWRVQRRQCSVPLRVSRWLSKRAIYPAPHRPAPAFASAMSLMRHTTKTHMFHSTPELKDCFETTFAH
jgi:hypothetical protein